MKTTLFISRSGRSLHSRLPALLLAAAILLAPAGCALNPWYTASRNIDNSKRLRVGMTKSEVLDVMGEPLTDEIFCKPDCWYYYIEPVWVDGLTTEEECMPLVFEEGKLVGWGRGFFVRYRLERKNAAQKGPASVPGAAIDSALGSPLPSSGSPQTPKKQ